MTKKHQWIEKLHRPITANIELIMRTPRDVLDATILKSAFDTARAHTHTMSDESVMPRLEGYDCYHSTGVVSDIESARAYFICSARSFEEITRQISVLIEELEKMGVEVHIGDIRVEISGNIIKK
jgi:hypothetical protein